MNRPENMCQPPEYPPEMFAEYFESAKKRALRTSQIESILGDDYDLDRLRELVEADRDGRCVVLPRKTVFELTWDAGPNCDMICPVNIDGEEQCDHCDKGELCVYERECKQEHLDKIGQTVFLTRESAEATLKGDQHGKQ